MSNLPTITAPEYVTHLPGIDRNIRYRPFLVREEKVLLMAKESEDREELIRAVKQVFAACVLDDLDVEAIPFFDFEKLFIRIRGHSVGDNVNLVMPCFNAPECSGTTSVSVDLNTVDVVGDIPDRNVTISSEYGVRLRFPTVSHGEMFEENSDGVLSLMASCLETIYEINGGTVWPVRNLEESREWLESLSRDQFTPLVEFFEAIPRVSKTVGYQCAACQRTGSVDLTGITDFFT